MHFFQGFTDSPMWRRFAATLAACALLPLLMLALLAAQELGERDRRAASDAGAARRLVRRRARGATRVPRSSSRARSRPTARLGRRGRRALQAAAALGIRPVHAGSDRRLALRTPGTVAAAGRDVGRGRAAGGSALVTLEARRREGNVYLVRDLRIAGRGVQAYFELAPDWLWRDAATVSSAAIVVDGRATVLFQPGDFPAHGASVLRAQVLAAGSGGNSEAGATPGGLAWQAGGREWRGALAVAAAAAYAACGCALADRRGRPGRR